MTNTIVAYHLKGEDHTATLVAKQGLFWLVTNDEKGEHKIPAKAVEETWEEGEELTTLSESPAADASTAPAEPAELAADPEPATGPETPAAPNQDGVPSLADQAATGPTIAEPKATITLAELAADQGFEPRIARRQLRAAVAAGKLAHDHAAGWEFPNTKDSIEAVMAIITARKRG